MPGSGVRVSPQLFGRQFNAWSDFSCFLRQQLCRKALTLGKPLNLNRDGIHGLLELSESDTDLPQIRLRNTCSPGSVQPGLQNLRYGARTNGDYSDDYNTYRHDVFSFT